MAYTRPSASAADASWQGAAAYTRPAATEANATFLVGNTFQASGFSPTQFGTPVSISDQFCDASGFIPTKFGAPTHGRTQQAGGLSTTQFGTPTGYKLQRAQGFCTTQFGTPYLHPSHVALWPVSTRFGSPAGRQFWRIPSMGQITRFGTPTTPTNRTCDATGFNRTQLGKPLAWRVLPPNTNQSCRAYGFKTTQIGSPVAHWSRSEVADGFIGTQLGTPRAFTTHHTSGFAGTQFGSTMLRPTHHASGFSAAQLGSPTLMTTHHAPGTRGTMIGVALAIMTQRASGLAPRTRFGIADTIRSDWYTAYGFLAAKFGYPTGYERNNHHASGFNPTEFGDPSMRQTHRVTHIAPTSRFGRPLLRRITQC